MLFAIPYDKFHPSRVVCLHSFQNPENHSYRVQMQDGPLQNHLCFEHSVVHHSVHILQEYSKDIQF